MLGATVDLVCCRIPGFWMVLCRSCIALAHFEIGVYGRYINSKAVRRRRRNAKEWVGSREELRVGRSPAVAKSFYSCRNSLCPAGAQIELFDTIASVGVKYVCRFRQHRGSDQLLCFVPDLRVGGWIYRSVIHYRSETGAHRTLWAPVLVSVSSGVGPSPARPVAWPDREGPIRACAQFGGHRLSSVAVVTRRFGREARQSGSCAGGATFRGGLSVGLLSR
jgi:hypothetical protein